MEESFRKSLFQVISLHTSTGFATDDYMQWSPVLWGLLTIIMLMGACAGSTTGGLKCIRMVILTKSLTKRVQTHPTPQCHTSGTDKQAGNLSLHCLHRTGFLFYLYLHYSHRHTAHDGYGCRGLKNQWAASFPVSVIWDPDWVKPDLPIRGMPCPMSAKWLLSFLMLLGRLELFTVLLLFTPDFWKRN